MTECDRFYVVEASHNLSRLQMLLIAGTFPQKKQSLQIIIIMCIQVFSVESFDSGGRNSLKKSNIQLDPF